jgi:hypothetical protein
MDYISSVFTEDEVDWLLESCMLNFCCEKDDYEDNEGVHSVCTLCKNRNCSQNCRHKNKYTKETYKPSRLASFFEADMDDEKHFDESNIFDSELHDQNKAKGNWNYVSKPKIARYTKDPMTYNTNKADTTLGKNKQRSIITSRVPYCTELKKQYKTACDSVYTTESTAKTPYIPNVCNTFIHKPEFVSLSTAQKREKLQDFITNNVEKCQALRPLNSDTCILPRSSHAAHQHVEHMFDQAATNCKRILKSL